jgi:hypothetical protein
VIGVQGTQVILSLSLLWVGGLVIFVTAFLLGLWCGWMWRRQRGGPSASLWRDK